MITKSCKTCEGEIETYPSVDKDFCDPACYGEWESVKRVELSCEVCEESYEVIPSRSEGSRFCSLDCRREGTAKDLEVEYVEAECEWCDQVNEVQPHKEITFRFCYRDCRGNWESKNRVGENHPLYNGGEYHQFGDNYEKNRQKVLDRDEVCQVCGGDGSVYDLHVHHIVPRRLFERWDKPVEDSNKASNLVTLCNRHHKMVEHDKVECPTPWGEAL